MDFAPHVEYSDVVIKNYLMDSIGYSYLNCLPTRAKVKLIPLEITDETHDLYYAEVTIYLCVMFIEYK